MYKIMAADGAEYGPVSREQVQQWILEKRVGKKTPVFVDGEKDWIFLDSLPEFSTALNTPPPLVAKSDGGLNVIIPYKNIRALAAYYLGVFAVIPVLGMALGLAGFVLGILGLRFRRKNPTASGAVHAWIGIVVGGIFALLWLAVVILAITALARRHH